MKRSEINRLLEKAKAFLNKNGFFLPPFACWSPADWARKGGEYDEIRRCRLGWDVTDSEPISRGCVALFSDWFPATTGEIIHVDGGFHAMGA